MPGVLERRLAEALADRGAAFAAAERAAALPDGVLGEERGELVGDGVDLGLGARPLARITRVGERPVATLQVEDLGVALRPGDARLERGDSFVRA